MYFGLLKKIWSHQSCLSRETRSTSRETRRVSQETRRASRETRCISRETRHVSRKNTCLSRGMIRIFRETRHDMRHATRDTRDLPLENCIATCENEDRCMRGLKCILLLSGALYFLFNTGFPRE